MNRNENEKQRIYCTLNRGYILPVLTQSSQKKGLLYNILSTKYSGVKIIYAYVGKIEYIHI